MPPPAASYGRNRQSTLPTGTGGAGLASTSTSTSSSAATSIGKQRQFSHLNSQLAQLQSNLSDLEDLVRMTAVQAEHIRDLGGIHAALLMSSAKILGEDGGAGAGSANHPQPPPAQQHHHQHEEGGGLE